MYIGIYIYIHTKLSRGFEDLRVYGSYRAIIAMQG